MNRRRVRFRPPGVKPGGKIGPLGPFRGRLGAHWWIASVVVGFLLLGVGAWYFLRDTVPRAPWTPVAALEEILPGEAREAGAGIFVGRLPDGRPAAIRESPSCPVEYTESRYRDCRGTLYHLNGQPEGPGEPLTRLPLQVHDGRIYLDPS